MTETAAAVYRLCPRHGAVPANEHGLCPDCTVYCPVCGKAYESDTTNLPDDGPQARVCDPCFAEFIAWAKVKKGMTEP